MNISKAKQLIAAAMLGAFALTVPVTTDARIHDPKVETRSVPRGGDLNGKTLDMLNGAIPLPEEELYDYDDYYTQPEPLPVHETVSTYDTSIIGTPMATQQQCVRYLLRNNPNPNLNVSAEEIVAYYYEEGSREGIRPDVAFAQALKETGFFRYGGDVIPEQNNYCGLGTTGGGVKGEFFSSPRIGVRAHIQHLLAYSSTRRPTMPVVDPRYGIVRQAYGSRTLGTWQDLNGRWAVPGNYYGQEILSMFRDILIQ